MYTDNLKKKKHACILANKHAIMKVGCGTRESTCTINSSKTLLKIFVPLTIDCFTTITSLSRKNVNSTDISVGECSTALKPISSIILKCSEGIKLKINIYISVTYKNTHATSCYT